MEMCGPISFCYQGFGYETRFPLLTSDNDLAPVCGRAICRNRRRRIDSPKETLQTLFGDLIRRQNFGAWPNTTYEPCADELHRQADQEGLPPADRGPPAGPAACHREEVRELAHHRIVQAHGEVPEHDLGRVTGGN